MILGKRLQGSYNGPPVELAIVTNDSGNISINPAVLFEKVMTGDQLVVMIGSDAGTDPDPGVVSGWTQRNYTSTSTNTSCLYTRTATGSDEFTTTSLDVIDWDAAIIGVAKIRQFSYSSLIQSNGTTGTPNPGSLTPNSGDYSLIFGYVEDQDATMVPAGGYYDGTDGEHLTATILTASTDQGSGLVGIRLMTATGAWDPGAFTGATSDGWCAYHVRLIPA